MFICSDNYVARQCMLFVCVITVKFRSFTVTPLTYTASHQLFKLNKISSLLEFTYLSANNNLTTTAVKIVCLFGMQTFRALQVLTRVSKLDKKLGGKFAFVVSNK